VAGLRCGDRRAGHGYFTLRDQIFGSDPQPQPQPPPPAIPYFEGVAGQRVGLGFSDALPPPRCMTWEILVEGRDNDESGIYVMHGTPRLEGYFLVDSGDLQMGITPVGLKPITFGEAQAPVLSPLASAAIRPCRAPTAPRLDGRRAYRMVGRFRGNISTIT
jgi:hypothetical protein